MRTFSSFLRREVVTKSGAKLGRCRDLRGDLTEGTLRITGVCVGGYAWLEHLGIGLHHPKTIVPWDDVVELRGEQIVVRDDHAAASS